MTMMRMDVATGESVEAWRRAWRDGFAPLLATPGLRALLSALIANDPRLLQGQSVGPLPRQFGPEDGCDPCYAEAGCPVCYALLHGRGGDLTPEEVEDRFCEAVAKCGLALNEPAGPSYFLQWWDQGERGAVRADLALEVVRELDGLGAPVMPLERLAVAELSGAGEAALRG
jgi:hypothetical protein